MASTYSSNLKLQLMGTGDNAGTWGDVTNVNLGTALEESIAGTVDVSFSSSDVTLTLTDDNTAQTARNMRLNLTGTSGGARNLIVPAIEKMYVVNNGLADACTIKVSGQTGVSVPAGKTTLLFNNGTDVVNAINTLADLTVDTDTLVVDSTNNRVGIGTASPDKALHISASDSATLRIESTDTSLVANQVVGAIEWESNESSVGSNGVVGKIDLIAEDTTPEYAMRFFTHDTSGGVPDFGERMRIDSSGDVGIGTSSPAKPLHVNSSTDEIFRLETSDNQTGNIYQAIHDASGELARIGMFDSSRILRLNNLQADGEVAFFTNNTERMRIDSSGDVGIGTSSPAKNLHVSSTGSPTFRIQDTDGSDYYAEIQQASGNTIFSSRFGASNGAFVFRGLGGGTADEHMRIDSSGDVGIGTTSPAATVDVSGNARGAVVTDNDLSFDLSASNNFNCTPTGGGTLTFTNHLAGQSGFVWLDNSGGHAIAAAGTTKINAADLTAISTAGVYTLSYFDNGTNAYVSVSRSFA